MTVLYARIALGSAALVAIGAALVAPWPPTERLAVLTAATGILAILARFGAADTPP